MLAILYNAEALVIYDSAPSWAYGLITFECEIVFQLT